MSLCRLCRCSSCRVDTSAWPWVPDEKTVILSAAQLLPILALLLTVISLLLANAYAHEKSREACQSKSNLQRCHGALVGFGSERETGGNEAYLTRSGSKPYKSEGSAPPLVGSPPRHMGWLDPCAISRHRAAERGRRREARRWPALSAPLGSLRQEPCFVRFETRRRKKRAAMRGTWMYLAGIVAGRQGARPWVFYLRNDLADRSAAKCCGRRQEPSL